jgi:hypothetical protein
MAVAPATSELGLDGAGRSVLTTTAPMFPSLAMHDAPGPGSLASRVVCMHRLPSSHRLLLSKRTYRDSGPDCR